MRIVCISDTHDVHYPTLPNGDLLIHAGDVSLSGSVLETQRFMCWFNAQPHRFKIFVGGNHDTALEDFGPGIFHPAANVVYLNNSRCEILGCKIFGTPVSRTYGRTQAFMHSEERLAAMYAAIPHDIDILIAHGPAWGLLDAEANGTHLGSPALHAELMSNLNPKLAVWGHIHGGYGQALLNKTLCVNAAHLDVTYRQHRDPIVVEW